MIYRSISVIKDQISELLHYYCENVFLEWINLTYDSIPSLELSLQSPIEFIQKTYDDA